MTQLIILGAGGHGAVVAEIAIASSKWDGVSFVDDDLDEQALVVGCPVLGDSNLLPEILQGDYQIFVAIGNNQKRDENLSSIEELGGVLANVVHPNAVVSPSAFVDLGTVICAGAVINARTRIGRGSIVNTGASVDHDCVLGRAVHVSPGVHVAGNVSIGDRSWLGVGAAVIDGISIQSDCIVGAGAAVIDDVESGQTIVGVPANPLGRA